MLALYLLLASLQAVLCVLVVIQHFALRRITKRLGAVPQIVIEGRTPALDALRAQQQRRASRKGLAS